MGSLPIQMERPLLNQVAKYHAFPNFERNNFFVMGLIKVCQGYSPDKKKYRNFDQGILLNIKPCLVQERRNFVGYRIFSSILRIFQRIKKFGLLIK